jgi:hypothetical protein
MVNNHQYHTVIRSQILPENKPNQSLKRKRRNTPHPCASTALKVTKQSIQQEFKVPDNKNPRILLLQKYQKNLEKLKSLLQDSIFSKEFNDYLVTNVSNHELFTQACESNEVVEKIRDEHQQASMVYKNNFNKHQELLQKNNQLIKQCENLTKKIQEEDNTI